jgi:hypothetical protein
MRLPLQVKPVLGELAGEGEEGPEKGELFIDRPHPLCCVDHSSHRQLHLGQDLTDTEGELPWCRRSNPISNKKMIRLNG